MIKVSRTLKENGYRIRKAAEDLSQQLGRNATIDEIAAATELTAEDIVLAMEANSEVDSIYRTVYRSDGKDIALIDQVVGVRGSSLGYARTGSLEGGMVNRDGALPDAEKDELVDRILLRQLLDGLGEKERTLIEYRYFRDMTQTQVAERMGISQVQVSRLEKKILNEMRRQSFCGEERQQGAPVKKKKDRE